MSARWAANRAALRCSGCGRAHRVENLLLQAIGEIDLRRPDRMTNVVLGWTICRQCLWGTILATASPLVPRFPGRDWNELLSDEFWEGVA